MPPRWDLTDAERARVEKARRVPFSMVQVVQACRRSPSLTASVLRSALTGAAQGVRGDQSLAWILDSQRIRRVVPGAPTGVGWHGEEVFLEALLPRLDSDQRVLEIGCGAGRVARHVAPEVGQLVCSDISKALLDEARHNLAGLARIDFHRATGFHLADFEDAAFDVIYSHDVFVTFDLNEALALLDEARRALRPNGVLVVSFYTIDHPSWAAHQLEIVRRAAKSNHFGPSHPRAYTAAQVDALYKAVGLEVVDRLWGTARVPGGRAHYVAVGSRLAVGTEPYRLP